MRSIWGKRFLAEFGRARPTIMRGVATLCNRLEHVRGLMGGHLAHDRALSYSLNRDL